MEPPNCEKNTCGESGICDVTDHPVTGFPTILCMCMNGTEFYKSVDCGPCKFFVQFLNVNIKQSKSKLYDKN